MDARLIVDPPASGPWNMAVDETLREWSSQTGQPVVRFYQWSPATLSLGYFQAYTARTGHRGSAALAVVRRASGGGAIVHDQELTYSFVSTDPHRFVREDPRWVEIFHTALIETLREWGLSARLQEAPPAGPRRELPFLCFQRRSLHDVLLGDHKVVGSAQRRIHGAMLQHGSVLLSRSDHASELPGIAQLAGRKVSAVDLREAWAERLAVRLDVHWVPSALPAELSPRVEWWRAQRFASTPWTTKR